MTTDRAILPALIVILGPTAVGKSEIAIQLAERVGGEIISADSRLFYRRMDIGTAKPAKEELNRIPHHLIDVADPDEVWTLATFQQKARDAISSIHGREKLPLLVGGTGQYIRAVTLGWQAPRVEPDPQLRQALSDWAVEIGEDGLHERLAVLDAQAADRIDPRNLRRTVRALEVILSSGRRFSDQRGSGPSPYDLLLIGLKRPRPDLYARIDARIDDMIKAGWVEEVSDLLSQGYDANLPSLSAIGYREITAYLQGKLSLEEAVQEIKRATRILVRRQGNWFKSDDPDIHWFEAADKPIDAIEAMVNNFIAKRSL